MNFDREKVAAAKELFAKGAERLAQALFFSPAHDDVWPASSTCACIEHGGLTVIRGRRLFSRIRVMETKTYPTEGYPPPDLVASSMPANEVTLFLPPSWIISRTAEFPATVAGSISQAVEFELDRLTPLNPRDALYDFVSAADGREKITIALSACRADVVAPYVKALTERNINVKRVVPAPDNGKVPKGLPSAGGVAPACTAALADSFRSDGSNLLARGRKDKKRPPLSLTFLLLAALAAAVIASGVLPLSMERKRIAEIDKQIGALRIPVRNVEHLRKEVAAQEKEIGTIESFRRRPGSIDLFKEITTTLPKNAWLTRAHMTDKAVDLEGYAGSAAEILPKIEASPFFRKAEFASPTFRDTRLNADRFVIRAEIENDKVKDEAKK
jgi:Tfp pilus assembly protein PilN